MASYSSASKKQNQPGENLRGRMSPFNALPPISSTGGSSGVGGSRNATFGADLHTISGPMIGSSSSVADITRKDGRPPPMKPKLPMPGHGKSIKSSSKPTTMSFNSKPSALADRSRPAIAGGDNRHLSVLQNPNIAHAQTKFELRTPQSSSTLAQNETVTVQKTSKNITTTNEIIKLCIKMPNSAREILTVKSSATFNQILTMIQKKKRFKEPEFITSDVPAKRISGNKLALSLIDFGIENNSVLHCDELL